MAIAEIRTQTETIMEYAHMSLEQLKRESRRLDHFAKIQELKHMRKLVALYKEVHGYLPIEYHNWIARKKTYKLPATS